MTREQAQALLSQWSRPWFNINSSTDVSYVLEDRMRERDAVQAFRYHCLYALIEAAVGRARQAAARPGVDVRVDPHSRLSQLNLAEWIDPVAISREPILRATTNVAYDGNNFRENHRLEATLSGPLVRVTLTLEEQGTPPGPLKTYTADEIRDTRGRLLYEIVVSNDRLTQPGGAPPRRR